MRAALVVIILLALGARAQYEPNWDSLDSRPLPKWFDEAKIGIFIHWGVYSVPSIHSEWFWNDWKDGNQECVNYMDTYHRPGFTYQEFAPEFTAEFFDPHQWAQLFKRSGAKYVVLTTKHHDGFSLYPNKYSFSWNSLDLGPHRDLVAELGEAVRGANLTYGLYHSLMEWFNPLWLSDQKNQFTTQEFVKNKVLPERKALINTYKPQVLYSDGDWLASDTYWQSTDFLAWLYNESPVKDTIVVNDGWGTGIACHHGDFITCGDRYDPGTLQGRKWLQGLTLDRWSWSYRRNAPLSDYLTISELLTTIVRTVSCGGNLLINVGPTKEGLITPIYEERLTQLGEWLDINGEAIYGSSPWPKAQNDSLNGAVWYTSKAQEVYAIDLEWPQSNIVTLGSVLELFQSPNIAVTLLGNEGPLKWTLKSTQVDIILPDKATVKSQNAFVLKITPKQST